MTVNRIEERILQQLIERGPNGEYIKLEIADIPKNLLESATDSLLRKKLIKQEGVTFKDHFKIALESDGLTYFEEKNKAEYGEAYAEKVCLIERYIKTASTMLGERYPTSVANFIEMYIRTFENEIKNIYNGLDYWRHGECADEHGRIRNDWRVDLQVITNVLSNHLANIKIEAHNKKTERLKIENNFAPVNQVAAVASASTNVEITIQNTITNVMEIKGLNATDKETLCNMISEIEKLKNGKDKKTLLDKVKKASMWVLDKGVDVMVAVMPYLLEVVK